MQRLRIIWGASVVRPADAVDGEVALCDGEGDVPEHDLAALGLKLAPEVLEQLVPFAVEIGRPWAPAAMPRDQLPSRLGAASDDRACVLLRKARGQ